MPDPEATPEQSDEYEPQGRQALMVLVYAGFALLLIGVAMAARELLDGIGSWVAG